MVLATPTQRILAHTLDSIAIILVTYGGGFVGALIASVMSGGAGGPMAEPIYNENLQVGFLFGSIFWFYVAWFLNFFIYQGLTGSSVGKKIIKIQVIRMDGTPITVTTACLRGLYFILSSISFYLGFLWIYVNKRHQSWHDILARTIVVSHGVPAVLEDDLDSTPNQKVLAKSIGRHKEAA